MNPVIHFARGCDSWSSRRAEKTRAMAMSDPALPDYVLGRTPEEYARLEFQARIVRPYTERYFRAAGLAPGMRVLELGSGVGEVAVIAAEIVGPSGHVHGIDVDG